MTGTNFLFVSLDGLIGDIAWRVKQHGNDVKYAITEDEFSQDVCDGLVPKTDDWRAELEWADVVVMDDSFGLGREAERLREEGIPVVGGTELTDRLEEDRGFGHETMRELGLNVIESRIFESLDAGIEYVRNNPAPYVLKPSGDTQNFNELLYVGQSEDGADVVQMLQRYRDKLDGEVEEFQLQLRKTGIEISVCGFFDGEQFVEPINYTFEHKRLFPGDLGPMTGEMGTAMFWGPPNRLFHGTIAPFEPLLRKEGYVGAFDINCIVNGDGIFPLEITSRFGYPQIAIQEAAMETPIDDFLYGLAAGTDPELETHDGFQVGLRVCVPPFPADDVDWFEEHSRDLQIGFREEGLPDGIHLEDMKHTDGEFRVAGETGEVLVATGLGETMQAAKTEAEERADDVVLPNNFYRTDIGSKWQKEAEQLIRWGYLRN
ncbi:phosphoribosylamine--glycine ligase [Halobaculum sp. WSA2]|uniref:phosphoribosylamine--glycine ligase n=1 Tax=Halobaculum saliterrae TaxID=2073113 RepID=A0A6B0SVA9_9EURY|nr:phosphoribosylamine--glycine ligase [Halobaculum saliterrae]MXR39870.1 phosphoribosylamine--glycine ligase [Halobaculum saliterrae]